MKKLAVRLFPLGLVLLCACADGLQPVPFQGVSGSVTFVGRPPDSTDWVRVTIYRRVPGNTLDLLNFVAFSDTLLLELEEAPYAVALEPGAYQWMPAVWKEAEAPLSVASLLVAGWYTGGAPFAKPRTFLVESERETRDVNLIVDFNNMLTADETLEALR